MKKITFLLFIIIFSSCNKKLYQYCEEQNTPKYNVCFKDCELALPEPGAEQSKEDAVKNCQRNCKVKLKEDALNCYNSRSVDCIKECVKDKREECKLNKKNCKNLARTTKNNCLTIARANKRRCLNDCNNLRGRQKRQCKRDCRRTFRISKRGCKAAFRNQKRQCKVVKCKKTEFTDVCIKDCK